MSEIQDEDIITLTDENGNDVEFLLLDVVEYNNDDYMVMIPLDVEVDGDNGMYELGDLTDAQLAKALEGMQEKLAEKK